MEPRRGTETFISLWPLLKYLNLVFQVVLLTFASQVVGRSIRAARNLFRRSSSEQTENLIRVALVAAAQLAVTECLALSAVPGVVMTRDSSAPPLST